MERRNDIDKEWVYICVYLVESQGKDVFSIKAIACELILGTYF